VAGSALENRVKPVILEFSHAVSLTALFFFGTKP
jgi:hypothetical protein